MASLFDYLEVERQEIVAEEEEKKRALRHTRSGGFQNASPANAHASRRRLSGALGHLEAERKHTVAEDERRKRAEHRLSTSRTTGSRSPQGQNGNGHHRTPSNGPGLAELPLRASFDSATRPVARHLGNGRGEKQHREGSAGGGSRLSPSDALSRSTARAHSATGVEGAYGSRLASSRTAGSIPLVTNPLPPRANGPSSYTQRGQPSPRPPPSPGHGRHGHPDRIDANDADDEQADLSANDMDNEDSEDASEMDGASRGRRRGPGSHRLEGGSAGNGSVGEHGTKKEVKFAGVIKKRGLSPYKGRTSSDSGATATGVGSESAKKEYPHPNTSYEGPAGGTPPDSQDEEVDMKHAQKLPIRQSPVITTAPSHRTMLTIIRGHFGKMQLEAESGLRRQRVYVVATDLSPEAAYALEWTIGACLRDGDTLFAVFAMSREGNGNSADSGAVAVGQGANMMEDANKMVLSFTDVQCADKLNASQLEASSEQGNESLNKAERERYDAVKKIASTCITLLRRTRLQVRVVVEVFHCESPKHMLTEAIDFIDPTLVVIGSRGRSSLKGVLLGSFSNYLVNKSSVPVMVARKRLRTHTKLKRDNLLLSNNINPARKVITPKLEQAGTPFLPQIE